ncbi:MAG: TIGR02206 family membrane protein [Lamprobacter sp.]|uniref:YwaF family protein n=1 Tax=Lamprobacter sp. TaxID=3100796 RepID=UPI002B25D2F1|nr:TIGR02206 family membrane protein [Lamprobacter sp.]MEA3641628.1 TIGR02206 family membrane protein [Lamprobacter sp.]
MHYPAPFVLFDTAHLLALALVALVGGALPLAARRWLSLSWQVHLGQLLGLMLLVQEIVGIWLRTQYYGEPWTRVLPLHLCGLAVLLTAWTLLWRHYRAYEIVYFWAWGGALQALLTPDLRDGFPDPRWISFFIGHGLILIGVLYATLVYRFRPWPISILKSLASLALAALLIAPLNLLLDANYLFLSQKPQQASLMDLLGPWPWYLGSLALLALLSSLVFYLPFLIRDWRARRTSGTIEKRSLS